MTDGGARVGPEDRSHLNPRRGKGGDFPPGQDVVLYLVRLPILIGLILGSACSQGTMKAGAKVPTPLETLVAAAHRLQASLQPQVRKEIALCMHRRGYTYPRRVSNHRKTRHMTRSAKSGYQRALWGRQGEGVVLHSAQGRSILEIFPASCVARGNAAVYGSQIRIAQATADLNELLAKLQTGIRRDSTVRAVTHRWSDCMRSRGYNVSSPDRLRTLMVSSGAGAPASPRVTRATPEASATASPGRKPQSRNTEIEVLRAGGICRQDVGLDSAIHQARWEHESNFVKHHRVLLKIVWPTRLSELLSHRTSSSAPQSRKLSSALSLRFRSELADQT
jgi:hypothetical protein